jgi:acetyl esterase/lipase
MKRMMVWNKTVPLIIILLGLSLNAASAQRIETGFLDREITLGGVNYRYQVYVPFNYDRNKTYPVILYLHSIAERGEDGLKQTQIGLGTYIRQDRERFPFIAVFPQARRDQFWTGDMATLALKTLDKTIEEFNGDPKKLYLTGISMGGHGTWYLASQAPEKFAAIVPICGFVVSPKPDLPPERKAALFKVNPLAQSQDPYTTVASQISKVPTWIFHGSADPDVSPDESRRMFQALKASGANVKYTEYEGVAHNAWDRAYSERDLVFWLLSRPHSKTAQLTGPAAQAQMTEKGLKTITLPNGEVIPDLNGEWDAFIEPYGPWSIYVSYPNIIKIIHTGSSFIGIRMMNDPYYSKGWETFIGELDKSGFKKIGWKTNLGVLDAKGQISEGGNKIIFDDGEKAKATLTRKMASTAQAQTTERGLKTITLPNGEVIPDLNGEWDALTENYGEWKEYGSYKNIIKIIQTAGSLVGIKMLDDPWYPKGWKSIKAELDKGGFKKVELMARAGPQGCRGQISDDGNKIVIDDGVKHKVTLNRK